MRIQLTEAEKASLIHHYLAIGFAADQLGKHPVMLFELTNRFNNEHNKRYLPGQILQYIITQRKQKKWIQLGKNAKRFSLPDIHMSLLETSALKVVYLRNAEALDNYLYHPKLAERLSIGLRALTGRHIEKWTLIGLIMNLRKNRQWITLDTDPAPFEAVVDIRLLEQAEGFEDRKAS